MITIDGSAGEGGGQVLRTALALSMATGRPFRIERIRAGRRKPGLMRQHLTAVEGAAAISDARVEGAALGSRELSFEPHALRPGRHELRVGTAGSTTLVLQATLAPLLAADSPSELVIEGGTHVPFAPVAEFTREALVPLLARMGARVSLVVERHGFYPAGGGRLVVGVEPAGSGLQPLRLHERGQLRWRSATCLCSRLPPNVAERELAAVSSGLSWPDEWVATRDVTDAAGPGNALVLVIEAEHATEVFTAIGDPRRSSESVADEAIRAARRWLAAGVPVGPHLADQLMVPCAIAGGGSFRTQAPTRHALTNDEIVRLFVDLPTRWEKNDDRSWTWSIGSP